MVEFQALWEAEELLSSLLPKMPMVAGQGSRSSWAGLSSPGPCSHLHRPQSSLLASDIEGGFLEA